MKIGDRIRSRRLALGISQTELARLTSVSKQTLYKYEKGIVTNMPISQIEVFAKALGVTPAYLMGWEDESTQPPPAIPPGFVPLPETEKAPLVGSIACGQPILAAQNIEELVDVPAGRGVDFCLLCKGDSMIDAGIHDGDIVYIRQQPDVENGEIAAVRIGSEATLKRVYKSAAGVMLAPANAAYTPQMYGPDTLDDIQIEGKAVGWTHWV